MSGLLNSYRFMVASGGGTEGADNVADAGAITIPYTGPMYVKNLGSMAGYTTESGEKMNGGTNFARTAWWSFTPDRNGKVQIDTVGGTADAQLCVYTGTPTIAGLTQVAYDDDSAGSSQAKIVMTVTAGTTYYIQYGTYPAATANPGILRMIWLQTAPNDNWANARVVTLATTGATFTEYVDNSTATTETGENTSNKGKTVWYSYTPASSGSAQFDTIGTLPNGGNTDTNVALYTGASLAGLTQVASDDDAGGSGTSKITFSVTAGVTYYFQVAAFSSNNMFYKVNITGPAT